jgi:MFS family permease
MTTLTLRRTARPVPAEYRSIFFHFYLDIAWYGLLSGSAIAFVSIFATRLGAAGWELGLLTASPAIVGLFLTLPAGRWLESRPIGRAVFWTSVFYRVGYLPWMFLPLLFNAQTQVWALIVITLLMSIPGTALAVGFNAMFAAGVPAEWRGHVVGTRNALLALTYIGASLLSGWLLSQLAFPLGYQVVFGIGFLGAVMSSLHLWFAQANIKEAAINGNGAGQTIGDQARPGLGRTVGDGLRSFVGLRFLTRSQGRPLINLNLLRGSYGRFALLLFAFHLTQFLANPLYPLYWVRELNLTDQQIGLGTALFYVTVFLGSTQLNKLSERLGNHKVATIGILGMSSYPILTAFTTELTLYLLTAAFGGLAWALAGGALGNYILERIPEDDRPAHLAVYNLALNSAILLGSLGGPFLADLTGIVTALILATVFRLLAALAVWRWG